MSDDMELENFIEPCITVKTRKISETEMDVELSFIEKNPDIPEKFKQPLTEVLRKIPNLYSGKEFSEVPFPEEIYTHDIEFLDESKTKELYARPYPISGIHAEQLKTTIDKLVQNDILEPSDSPFVSPVFFVSKKINRDATAAEGRLVFDYRKLNSLIKPHYKH
jgi:hypothetical protein